MAEMKNVNTPGKETGLQILIKLSGGPENDFKLLQEQKLLSNSYKCPEDT
jgi:hypothetical protein